MKSRKSDICTQHRNDQLLVARLGTVTRFWIQQGAARREAESTAQSQHNSRICGSYLIGAEGRVGMLGLCPNPMILRTRPGLEFR